MANNKPKAFIWSTFYASVTSFRFHPRNEITDVDYELDKCAEIADMMWQRFELRFPPDASWDHAPFREGEF